MQSNILRLDADTWLNLNTNTLIERADDGHKARLYTSGGSGQGDDGYITVYGRAAFALCEWLAWCSRDADAEVEHAQATAPAWANELIVLRGHLSNLAEAAEEYQSRATAPHASHSHTCCGNHYTIGHTAGCFYAAAERDLTKRIVAARALLDSGKPTEATK